MAHQQSRSSGAGFGMLAILIALTLIIGPNFLPFLGTMSQIILMGFGTLFLLTGSVIIIITRLYRKTTADEAFVRTGMGGAKAIIDGGAIVIPVVHDLVPVSLQTIKLIVSRDKEHALITGDNLRADIIAEFYIKVQKNREDVLAAAQSLGIKAMNPTEVKEMLFEKLINALRTVAATKDLGTLHTKRNEFASAVQDIVKLDLMHNGFTLESVTISKLDQTPPTALDADKNVFDAQGLRRIAEITNASRVERNRIQMEADQQVKAQEVARDKFIYEQDIARSAAAAAKERDVQNAQNQAKQEAESFAAEKMRLAKIAEVERDKAIEVAEVEKAKAVQIADQLREQETKQAEITKLRTIEIAEREKEIAVATKEQERAKAEALRLEAEAEREKQNQAVHTVEIVQTAERDKQQKVINEQAEIQKIKLRQEMEADVKAYTLTRTAEAEQQAAEKQAAARRMRAEAEKEARTMEAEGERAVQMVPVDVERVQVEVKRKDLENKAEFETISRQLTVELARIEMEKEVRVAFANAMGEALAKAKMTVWGSPEIVKQMSEAFIKGQSWATMLDGFTNGMSGDTQTLVNGALNGVLGLVEKLTGSRPLVETSAEMSKE